MTTPAIYVTHKMMVEAVRDHARKNYDLGGWHVVVEAWDDDTIIAAVGKAWTRNGAIVKVARIVAALHDYAKDIQSA